MRIDNGIRHKWQCSAVVEQQTREGAVVSSNPSGHVSREFSAKNAPTSMKTGGRWLVAASPEFFFEKFCYYFCVFSHFHFAECKSLPSAFPALGKGFAECPTKSTRQRSLCREGICRQLFAECSTRQRLCRMQSLLCRVQLHSAKHASAVVYTVVLAIDWSIG